MLSPSNSDMSSNSSMHDGWSCPFVDEMGRLGNDDDCLDMQLNMLQMQRQGGLGFGGQQLMNGSIGYYSSSM